jgi:hypothetical protein
MKQEIKALMEKMTARMEMLLSRTDKMSHAMAYEIKEVLNELKKIVGK